MNTTTHSPSRSRRTRGATRPGMSLVEVTLSIAIVGGLLASVFTAVGVSAKRGYSTAQRTKAAWLARDLLAEAGAHPCEADADNILTTAPIDLTDVEGLLKATQGSSRAGYDSVYDYNNWTSTPPVDMRGNALPGFKGWTRAVTVTPINPQTLARRTTSDTAALITVLAMGPNGERATASIVRTQYTDTLRGISGSEDDGLIEDLVDGVGDLLGDLLGGK
jgi:type II secretory pathway pseudopilin PulG